MTSLSDFSDLPHVLMTRFNLATPGREAEIRNKPDWLEGRFELFERFCLPSVGNQTTPDFTWIIYFDKDTPQPFKDRITRLQREMPFRAYYTGLFPAEGWPRSLTEELGPLPDHVLTSRLDNDDALAVDYMARTRAAAQAHLAAAPALPLTRRAGIVITNGFIRSDSRCYRISHPCNAFTSWLESTADPSALKSAMGIAHMDAATQGGLVQVPGPGGWLQVVHGGNVSNKVRGLRMRPEQMQGRFLHPGALEGLEPAGSLSVALENAVVAPVRNGRDNLLGMVRQLRKAFG
ncbi:glycosyltransferase [Actibacterium sp. D379-3]